MTTDATEEFQAGLVKAMAEAIAKRRDGFDFFWMEYTADAVDALRAARQWERENGGGWQPIETAPRDGRDLLLYAPDEAPSMVIGRYVRLPEWEGWQYAEETLADLCPLGPRPTHWQSFPVPPAGGGAP